MAATRRRSVLLYIHGFHRHHADCMLSLMRMHESCVAKGMPAMFVVPPISDSYSHLCSLVHCRAAPEAAT